MTRKPAPERYDQYGYIWDIEKMQEKEPNKWAEFAKLKHKQRKSLEKTLDKWKKTNDEKFKEFMDKADKKDKYFFNLLFKLGIAAICYDKYDEWKA